MDNVRHWLFPSRMSWSPRKFGVDLFASGVYFSTWSIPLVLTANPLNFEDRILLLHPLGMAQLDGWTIARQQALGQSASTCKSSQYVCAHKPSQKDHLATVKLGARHHVMPQHISHETRMLGAQRCRSVLILSGADDPLNRLY